VVIRLPLRFRYRLVSCFNVTGPALDVNRPGRRRLADLQKFPPEFRRDVVPAARRDDLTVLATARDRQTHSGARHPAVWLRYCAMR
jgi:hypothetical protein